MSSENIVAQKNLKQDVKRVIHLHSGEVLSTYDKIFHIIFFFRTIFVFVEPKMEINPNIFG